MKEILKVKDLSVSNKDVEILKNISFHIKKGEILGIVGESGCGKSTLIRALIQMMNKSEKITNGEITKQGIIEKSLDCFSFTNILKRMKKEDSDESVEKFINNELGCEQSKNVNINQWRSICYSFMK